MELSKGSPGRLARQNLPLAWQRIDGRRRCTLAELLIHERRRAFDSFATPLVRTPVLARVEAALLAAHEPLTPRRLMKLAQLADTGEVRRQVNLLDQLLQRGRSAFQVCEIAGGYQLLTRPELRPWVEPFCQSNLDAPLSGPMLETLAIVAYRQPICRADIEAVRGVAVGEILRHLLEKGLIRLAGKEQTLGRPFLYATTRRFLEVFGLRNLQELPLVGSLARPASNQPVASDAEPVMEDATLD